MLGLKPFFRSLLATLAVALTFTFAQPVSAALTIPLANADFEGTLALGDFSQQTGMAEWFDTFSGFSTFRFRHSTQLTGNLTTVGVLGADNGFIYNPIGTFTANEKITVSGQALSRNGIEFRDFRISLWSGNVTGADGSTLTTLGATQLDSATVTAAGLGITAAAGAPESANFSFDLDAGALGTAGETLWLELAAVANTDFSQGFFDDIVVANTPVVVVPEPSSFMALGALGLVGLGIRIRRRRKQV